MKYKNIAMLGGGFIGDFYTYCKKVNKYPISNNNI